jgi:uncharacterized protein YeaO (DUF488 family)
MPSARRTKRSIVLKRAYEPAAPDDGCRVLVDRIWPRGCSKETLRLERWERELAPSAQLRKWFGHDPARWELFQQRYRSELDDAAQQARLHALMALAGEGRLTLVYGAKDEAHNHALVLQQVLAQV